MAKTCQLPSMKLTWPMKIDGWKMTFLLPIFAGAITSFRECTYQLSQDWTTMKRSKSTVPNHDFDDMLCLPASKDSFDHQCMLYMHISRYIIGWVTCAICSFREDSTPQLIWSEGCVLMRFDWHTLSYLVLGGNPYQISASDIGDTILHQEQNPKIWRKTTEKQSRRDRKSGSVVRSSGRPKGMFRMSFSKIRRNPRSCWWSKKSSSWVFLERIIGGLFFK